MKNEIIIGVESAIEGGSISLFRDGAELDLWIGGNNIARAEELLPNIDRLLGEHSININDVSAIAISTGPGSYTGIKVGIATALGLRAALRTTCLGLSALEAIYFSFGSTDAVVAVPMGRGMVGVQSFTSDNDDSAAIALPTEDLHQRIKAVDDGTTFIVHRNLYDEITGLGGPSKAIVNSGSNIAKFLCLAADSKFASKKLEPLFVERAAPE